MKCPACGSESPADARRCGRCRRRLHSWTGATLARLHVSFLLTLALAVTVGATAFWLGRESGRNSVLPRSPKGRPTAALVSYPTPNILPATGPVASEAGPTWAIYRSRDRLSDRPLLGARFGTASGTELFSVLCAEGQAAIALKKGLLLATDGASGNSKGVVSTILVGRKVDSMIRNRIEVRFEEEDSELVDVLPRNPAAFLRRIASSRRVRTATNDFDPTRWSDAIERVIGECNLGGRSSTPAQSAESR